MNRAAAILAGAALAGCSRNPSILLDTAGPHANEIQWLFWLFFWVCAAVWLCVIGLLGFATWRGLRRWRDTPAPATAPAEERRLVAWVSTGVGLTFAILTLFVGASYAVDRKLISLDSGPTMEIQITGHQWWWEIQYLGETPSAQFTTANELHVPSGSTVKLKLRSSDVIHSFWIPNVAGKRDIIPGRENEATIRVDRDGVWHGRCAEFCGYQHAFMGLTLIAETPDKFEKWKASQRLPAAAPQSDEEKRGQEIFETGSCGACHVIRGTSADGHSNYAPELTHLKSRSSIGAGAAPNVKGYLGAWILDPHGIKPGVHMPPNLQNADDFQALLAYLEILK
jgi:cytochrome c oxidase subunit II